jgi:hypothetical protein
MTEEEKVAEAICRKSFALWRARYNGKKDKAEKLTRQIRELKKKQITMWCGHADT